jgi:lysophospholipase L1-like esterase
VRLENGRRVLDVQAWLDRINKGRAPDYLIIELGVNGGCAQTAGSLVHHCEKEQVGKMRTLIAAIRAVAPETVIALCACLVGADQDAYGINYGLWPSAVQARANLFYLNSRWDRLVKELAAKGDSRIFYVPFGSAIHPVHGYIRSKEPAFPGSTTSVTRLSNALHPTLEGGCQLGDALAAFLLTHLGNAR